MPRRPDGPIKTKMLSARIPQELIDEIDAIAVTRRLWRTEVIVELLEKGLGDRKRTSVDAPIFG